MDGYTLSHDVQELLNEDSTSGFIDDKFTYDCLFEAATQFADLTGIIKKHTTLTTVDGQSEYNLPADFNRLYMRDSTKRLFVRLYDTSAYYWIYYKPYEDIILENQTDEQEVPNDFAIIQKDALVDNVTGTATSDGASTHGLAVLADTAATFTTYVTVGDTIYNTTDGSRGIVTKVTDANNITTALFGGTSNDWTSADVYGIIPKPRMQMVFNPTPSTSGYSIEVWYIAKPEPVYSDYSQYNIDNAYRSALAKYAAWLYKYRDREPNYGDKWYILFDSSVRRAIDSYRKQSGGFKMKMVLSK